MEFVVFDDNIPLVKGYNIGQHQSDVVGIAKYINIKK